MGKRTGGKTTGIYTSRRDLKEAISAQLWHASFYGREPNWTTIGYATGTSARTVKRIRDELRLERINRTIDQIRPQPPEPRRWLRVAIIAAGIAAVVAYAIVRGHH